MCSCMCVTYIHMNALMCVYVKTKSRWWVRFWYICMCVYTSLRIVEDFHLLQIIHTHTRMYIHSLIKNYATAPTSRLPSCGLCCYSHAIYGNCGMCGACADLVSFTILTLTFLFLPPSPSLSHTLQRVLIGAIWIYSFKYFHNFCICTFRTLQRH